MTPSIMHAFVAFLCFFSAFTLAAPTSTQSFTKRQEKPTGIALPKLPASELNGINFSGKAPNILGISETLLRALFGLVTSVPGSIGDLIGSLLGLDKNGKVVGRDDILGEEAAALEERVVLGADNRVLLHNSSFPYGAVGRVIWQDGTYCTGVLVGDRVVATASHCVPWSNPTSMIWQAAFYDKTVYADAQVTDVQYIIKQVDGASFDNSPCGIAKDFAVLRLNNVMSTVVGGKMGATNWQSAFSSLTHVGYPTDLAAGTRPYVQTGITASVNTALKCDNYGPLSTQADVTGGQSGGPLYYAPINMVVGVLSAGTSTTSVFAAGQNFVSMVAWARSNWPA